ncbi:MAG: GNAT family N-acetyltransferase [Chloroflexota bacterium]
MLENALLNLRTRVARKSDLPALKALAETSVRVLNSRDYTRKQIESALRYLLGVDQTLIDDGTYYVAEVNGRIIGSGGWSRREATYDRFDDTGVIAGASLLNPHREAARLRAFFVHPDWARHGIGRLMVRISELSARTHGFRKLELTATRTGIPLYLACGFRLVEQRDIVFPDGVAFDTFVMEKRLIANAAMPRSGTRTKSMPRPVAY